MNLPDLKLVQDAQWQQDYAARQLAPFLEDLRNGLAAEPTDPAARRRYDRNVAFLRALEVYFERTSAVIELLNEREDEMHAEMQDAQFRYTQMGIERDYLKGQLQKANERYYAESDTLTQLLKRFPLADA